MSGKTIKTDKLDAKFLAALHPSDHIPTVYIPSLEEEGRRDAEREWDRIKKSIDRVNAQMISLIERTPLPGFKSHRTAVEWRKAIRKWSKLPEWAECPSLLLLRGFPICLPNWSCSRKNWLIGNRPSRNSRITMKKLPNKMATLIRRQKRSENCNSLKVSEIVCHGTCLGRSEIFTVLPRENNLPHFSD